MTKRYLAVVHGTCERRTETISTYLAENRAHGVYSTANVQHGKFAQTAYTVLKVAKGVTLLDVDLLTGRKHQVRVHLADRGHPIVGDTTYGPPDRTHRRLGLHARSLSFRHPISDEELTFEATAPREFTALVGRFEHLLIHDQRTVADRPLPLA